MIPRLAAILAVSALGLAGCDQPRTSTPRAAGGPELSPPRVQPNPPAAAAPRGATTTPGRENNVLGHTTGRIENAPAEIHKGAQVTQNQIQAGGPVVLSGSAYFNIVGRLAQSEIQEAVNLYQATEGHYPKDYKEFVEGVLKPNNIRLPRLKPNQRYGYDPTTHQLLILQYPPGVTPPPQEG